MKNETISDIFENSGFSFDSDSGYKFTTNLNPANWKKKILADSVPDDKWVTVKYLNSKGCESYNFLNIPDDAGGIFMWMIRPKKIPNQNQSFIACVCAAETGVLRTIRQFIENGERKYSGDLSVKNLFDVYSSDLFVSYYSDKDRSDFFTMCNELNDRIDPPIKYMEGYLSPEGEDA